MSKHDLVEYGLAKQALKELPELKIKLDRYYEEMYSSREYFAISYVLDAIYESQRMLHRQIKEATEIVSKKGKV